MALLGSSVLAMMIGVAIFALLLARLWMRIVWRVVVLVLSLAAFGGLAMVVWLWVAR